MKTLSRLSVRLGLAGAGLALGLMGLISVSRVALAGTVVHSPQQPVALAALAQPSIVLDRDGRAIAVLHAGQNRSPVGYAALPPVLIHAVVDTEDHGFFTHGAIDVRSVVRAAAADVSNGAARQGGSTITQQLIKNAVLNSQKTLSRKLHEAVDAVRLQDATSHRQILDDYLNTIYFGEGAYGVESAARIYFGRHVYDLDTAQSALLAGLIQDPSGYDPIISPPSARDRRSTVLRLMVRYHHINPAEATAAEAAPLPTVARDPDPVVGRNGYFVQEVTQALLGDPTLGSTASERYKNVFEGGLRVTTTLDSAVQSAADHALETRLPDSHGRFTAAVVAIDPEDGGVRALAAGTDFARVKYDVATGRGGSGRQVGSSFKPFVLMTALAEGHSPTDYINGAGPCPIDLPGFGPYTAGNYEGEAFGNIDLTTALARSVNCAYLRLGAAVGLDRVVTMAHQLGITSALSPVPSLPLGTEELTPLQMASAYCTIDDGGIRHQAHFIERIQDPAGKLLESADTGGRQVAPRFAAEETTAALEQVLVRGTGSAARLAGHRAAGKTGTTSDYADAWFVGFSRQLCASVWMGSPTGRVPMRDVGGIAVAGGTYPARIWQAFMQSALAGQADLPLLDLTPSTAGAYISWPPVSPPATTVSGASTTTAPTTAPAGSPASTTITTSAGSPPTTSPPTTSPPKPPPPTATSPPPAPPPSSPPTTRSSAP